MSSSQRILVLQSAILSSTTKVPTSSKAADVTIDSKLTATVLADTKETDSSMLVASQSQVQTLTHPVLKPLEREIQQLELNRIEPSFAMMQPLIPAAVQVASISHVKTFTYPMPKTTQPVLRPFKPTGIQPSLSMMKSLVPVSTRLPF
jgi:hypothetical protein